MLSIPDLSNELKGRVIGPEDPGYDQARTVFAGHVDRRPAMIAKVSDAADIARVIALARESGLELAVRSGGHSGAGHGVSEGGIVLDVSELRELEIDAASRTAWVGSGVTAGRYTDAAGEHGLATSFGDTGSVGIGGIALCGGIGFLVRKHGMTIDDMLAAELVTADGELVRTDAENHPDLFWAIRGGGGNFGVVTRFKLRLHEVPSFVGGILVLPATADVILGFMAEADAAREELSTIANVMTAPPMPFLAEEHHGRPVVLAMVAYAGPAEEGDRVLAPFRALAEPLADMVQPMPYAEMFQPDEEEYRPVAASRTMFIDAIDQRAAQTILDRIEASTAMMAATQLRALGGAMARVPADATAFAHRQRPIMANVAAIYADPDEKPLHEAWVDDLSAELQRGQEGAYVGFLGDEGEERVRVAYPAATWDRLAQVKARYDPDNVFRLNQNIPPAL